MSDPKNLSKKQPEKQPERQTTTAKKRKKRARTSKYVERLFAVILALCVVFMSYLVLRAIQRGTASVSSSNGKTVLGEEYNAYLAASESNDRESENQNGDDPDLQETDPAQRILGDMSLEEKVYQLFITTPDLLSGTYGLQTADGPLTESLQAMPVGGLLLDSQAIVEKTQVTNLISGAQAAATYPLFIAVYCDPGYDSGLSDCGITKSYQWAASFGYDGDSGALGEVGREMGMDLRNAGFNLNFAPSADVMTNYNNTEVGYRSYGADPQVVSSMVLEMIQAMHDNEVIVCTKHFPGLAGTESSTRVSVVRSVRTMEELEATELIPFRNAVEAGTDMMLVSHMRYSSITTDDLPASLSPDLNQKLLRENLGFTGVIICDELQKGAVYDRTVAENSVMAIQAGCDMLLMPGDLKAAADGILAALEDGTLTEARLDESVLRILSLKVKYGIIS